MPNIFECRYISKPHEKWAICRVSVSWYTTKLHKCDYNTYRYRWWYRWRVKSWCILRHSRLSYFITWMPSYIRISISDSYVYYRQLRSWWYKTAAEKRAYEIDLRIADRALVRVRKLKDPRKHKWNLNQTSNFWKCLNTVWRWTTVFVEWTSR